MSLSTRVRSRPYFDASARGSVICCFQSLANFPLALSFSHETVAKAFLVLCRDRWSKRTCRILAEYYLRIQYIRPLGSETILGLHLSTSLDLRFHLFPLPMCHQQSQRTSGHPSWNGESANSYNSHKLLHLSS